MIRTNSLAAVGLIFAMVSCGSYDNEQKVATPRDERPAVNADAPPPPVSGGTLAVTDDGTLAVAADPDRDRVVIVDLGTRSVRASVELNRGDEPGRVVLDGARRAYVALRRGSAVAVIDLAGAEVLERLGVCNDPRGLAFDDVAGLLHVACAGGDLVSVSTADGEVARRLDLGPDLRDVVVLSDGLMVSRFRSAELLRIDAQGNLVGSTFPMDVMNTVMRPVEDGTVGSEEAIPQTLTPSVAWRLVSNGRGGVLLLHQRGVQAEIEPPGNGTSPYSAGREGCGSVVQSAVTEFTAEGTQLTTKPIAALTLGVDLAVSPATGNLLIADAGLVDGSGPDPRAAGQDGPVLSEPAELTGVGGALRLLDRVMTVAVSEPLSLVNDCAFGEGASPTEQPVVSVAFTAGGVLVAQSREPSQLIVAPAPRAEWRMGLRDLVFSTIDLGGASVYDTGHELFHRDSGGGIACASCHPEGREDGRVWEFANIGKRRTQPLDVGLEGSQPFHWSGDLPDLKRLVAEVFVDRMGGARQSDERVASLQRWLFARQPLTPRRPADDSAVLRGRDLFESPSVGCAACHQGSRFTHHDSFQVREGSAALQVPSLVGVGYRAPFMHDGCASTLEARFDPACGGGDLHGKTAQLSETERADLVSFLQSL